MTYPDLKAAHASLLESLQAVTTAVTINPIIAYTERAGGTVAVAIPDGEPDTHAFAARASTPF